MTKKYSVCIIDDKIPAVAGNIDDKIKIIEKDLKKLVNKRKIWADTEKPLKKIISQIIKEDFFSLSGFLHPDIFFNYYEDEFYIADIIIFDWEYQTVIDQSEYLLKLLNNFFCYIYIFTGADQAHSIETIISDEKFKKYKDSRLGILHKEEKDSHKELRKKIMELIKKDFSFKFGKEIRSKAVDTIDKILVELGTSTVNDIEQYFKLTGDTQQDLIDFLAERFRNYLRTTDFTVKYKESEKIETKLNEETAQELWTYRLYYYPPESDKIARKGDIIKNDDKFYIILTSDCDLTYHWNKNYGYITLLPIHNVKNAHIKNQILLTREESKIKKNLKANSFSESIKSLSQGTLLLPFVKIIKPNEQFEYINFIGFSKEIVSIKIESKTEINKEKLKNLSLKYEDNFKFQRIATISEPFLTPFIQNVLLSITGYGTPDYPDSIKNYISTKLGEIFK